MDAPRVVVTGVGMMTPVGVGRDASWLSLLALRGSTGAASLAPDEPPTPLAG